MKKIMIVMVIILLAGCSNTQENNERTEESANEHEQETDVSVSIQNLDVQVNDKAMEAIITGEASLSGSDLYYTLEQGDRELAIEESVELEANAHGLSSFEISVEIPEETSSGEQPPVVKLYGKNNSGEEINPNYIPIDVAAETSQ
ncbi:hypothetical protein [Oceanobacillus kapialis]|uniref:hypothetical protein n=1 Tax=Oceanobacillus kapialis TaxID=481353 RepID=UPI00384C9FC2